MAAFSALVPVSSTRSLRSGVALAAALSCLHALSCLAGCEAGAQRQQAASTGNGQASDDTQWHPCRVGGVGNARCGTVSVPLDHEAPAGSGGTIALKVAVLPALAAAPEEDPLVIFAGGPGQSAIDVGPLLDPLVPEIRKRRDILLVDQRGTGGSSPLQCDPQTGSVESSEVLSARLSAQEEMQRAFDPSIRPEAIERCLDAYAVDPKFFTTSQAVEDLEVVRRAMGYERLNLYGASYGTRAALAFLRAHPDAVRAVILDGVAPFDMALPVPTGRDGQRALALAAQACGKGAGCAKAWGDLDAQVDTLLDGLGEPRTVWLDHPRTGERVSVQIERDAVAALLHSALYSPTTSALIPLAVAAANEGDWGPLAALASARGNLDLYFGMFLSVVCAEDAPRAASMNLDAAFADSFLSPRLAVELRKACAIWPTQPVPDSYYTPVEADQPTLVLSGQLDPVTPPHWGESILAGLPHAQHVVVPGLGHGTWQNPCVARFIGDFIESPAEASPPACIDDVARPPFFASKAGPDMGSPTGSKTGPTTEEDAP